MSQTTSSSQARHFFPRFTKQSAARLLAVGVLMGACSSGSDSLDEVREIEQQVYNASNARITGFEDVSNDWAMTESSSPLASSSVRTQGNAAAHVAATGEFTITTTIPLSDLGTVGDTLTLDFRPPAVEGWTTLRVELASNDAQLYYADLGQLSTAGLTVGEYNAFSFPIPADAQSKLSNPVAPYDDLIVKIRVNGPAGDYYFDNLEFGGDAVFPSGGTGGSGSGGSASSGGASSGGGSSTGGTTGGTGGTPEVFAGMAIKVPRQTSFNSVALGAGHILDMHDGVQVYSGQPNLQLAPQFRSYADASNTGPGWTNLGVSAAVGGLYSESNVLLKNYSQVYGSLITGGEIEQGVGVTLNGVTTGAELEPYEVTIFTYDFPDVMERPPGLGENGFLQNGDHMILTEGGYVDTTVQASGTTLTLQGPGAFYFDALRIEAGSQLIVDNSQGAVFVVVRNQFRFKGLLTLIEPDMHNFMVAVQSSMLIDPSENFSAFLLAPNSTIELPTSDHHSGAYFGANVIVHQNTHIWHYPFERDDCDTACGLMFGCPGEPPIKACPGETGGGCSTDADCEDGLACGQFNGGCFGQSGGQNVCWPALCETSALNQNTGFPGAACGDCFGDPISCSDDDDCAAGDVCGVNNGEAYGSIEPNVCEPAFCPDATLEAGTCGSLDAPCGLCACTPDCSGKACGDDRDDGCWGLCLGLCEGGETGCTSNLDCEVDSVCVPTVDGTTTECRALECVFADTSSCIDGFNECGEPCDCGELCASANTGSIDPLSLDPSELPQEVGELSGVFNVSHSGTAEYSIPLQVPPGRAGLAPTLSIVYGSNAGDGPLGPGWQVSGFSQIYRCPTTVAADGFAGPINWEDSESTALCMDGERLINTSRDPGGNYRFRTEKESFLNVESRRVLADVDGEFGRFVVRDGKGLTYHYGTTKGSSIFGAARVKRVWALERVEDLNGNWIQYSYRNYAYLESPDIPRASMVPLEITYSPGGEHRKIQFKYDERGVQNARDLPKVDKWIAGYWTRSLDRLRAIEVVVEGQVRRRYRLEYTPLSLPVQNGLRLPWSNLEKVYECAVSGGNETCLKPTTFEYVEADVLETTVLDDIPSLWDHSLVVLDANGDGRDDLVSLSRARPGEPVLHLSRKQIAQGDGGPFRKVLNDSVEEKRTTGVRPCIGGHGVIDWDGDGSQELVDTCGTFSGNTWSAEVYGYSEELDQLVVMDTLQVHFDMPSTEEQGVSRATFMDVNGDSWADLVMGSPWTSTLEPSESAAPGIYIFNPVTRTFGAQEHHAEFEGVSPLELEFFDVDGDGTVEAVKHDISGDNLVRPWSYFDYRSGNWVETNIEVAATNEGGAVSLEATTFKFGDWNADGLTDVLSVQGGDKTGVTEVVSWTSRGNGQFEPRRQFRPHVTLDLVWSPKAFISSIVRPTPLGASLVAEEWQSDPGASGYFTTEAYFRFGALTANPNAEDDFSATSAAFTTAGDFNGDGNVDVLVQRPNSASEPVIRYTNWAEVGLLKAVETGFGRREEVFYEGDHYRASKSCGLDSVVDLACQTGKIPMVARVVRQERATTGELRSKMRTEYSYTNIVHGRGGRGSFGPETRETKHFDDEGSIVGRTLEYYNNTDWVKAGTLRRQLTSTPFLDDGSGSLTFREEVELENDWTVATSGAGRPYPLVFRSTESTWLYDAPADPSPTNVVTKLMTYTRDEFGNVTQELTQTVIPSLSQNWVEQLFVAQDYAHESDSAFRDQWLLSLPTKTTVTHRRGGRPEDHVPGGTPNPNHRASRVISRTFDATTGLPLTVTREGADDARLTTTLDHDSFGNLIVLLRQDATGEVRESRRLFDSLGVFPETLQDELGYISNVEFDSYTGGLKRLVDPNQLTSERYFDAFGRPLGKTDWQETTTISYTDPSDDPWEGNGLVDSSRWAKLRITATVEGGGREDVDFDAFQEPVMRRATGYSNSWVTTTNEYNWRGNLIRSTRPHAGVSSAPGVVEFAYDNWGRLVKEEFPDDTRIFHGYLPKTELTESSPWFSHQNAIFAEWVSPRVSDVATTAKEVVHSFDHNGTVVMSTDANAVMTAFHHGPFEQVLKVEHVVGESSPSNFTTSTYDDWGRLVSHEDPDMGLFSYEYSGFDEMRRVSDPRGLVTTSDYDSMGRTIYQRDDWLDGEVDERHWVYDSSPGGIGRLHFATTSDGAIERFEYYTSTDPQAGLARTVTLELEGETYSSTFKYDAFKRPSVISYPTIAGQEFEIVNSYDDNGLLKRVDAAPGGILDPNRPAVWEFEDAHEGYLVNEAILGGQTRRVKTFDDTTTRVATISATLGSDSVQQLSYQYFADGDLKSRQDHLNQNQGPETFTYDALHRLRRAERTIGGGNSTARRYEYDVRGNIVSQDIFSYTYDPTDKPHAVRSVGDNTYDYDEVGNQTFRQGSWVPGGEQKIDYNSFNLPRSVLTGPVGARVETEFRYNASGQRVLKRDDLHESVLFAGLYERVKAFGASLEETHKYLIYANGEMVAQVSRKLTGATLSDPETDYFLADALGSVATVVDDDGTIKHTQEFEPFGSSRNPGFSEPGVRYGFTGHAHDADIGLIDMGGRIYDAQLGRFLSADPYVQSPTNLQSHNRYSYVWNNPLGMVDPTGFRGGPPSTGAPPSDVSMGVTGAGAPVGGGPSGSIGATMTHDVEVNGKIYTVAGINAAGQWAAVNPDGSLGAMHQAELLRFVEVGDYRTGEGWFVLVWDGSTWSHSSQMNQAAPQGAEAGQGGGQKSAPSKPSSPSGIQGGPSGGLSGRADRGDPVEAGGRSSPRSGLDTAKDVLGVAANVPGLVGTFASLGSAAINIYQGNYLEAFTDIALAPPGVRQISTGIRMARNSRLLTKSLEGVSHVGAGLVSKVKRARATRGGDQTFEVLDGVRRSKAADTLGHGSIQAQVIGLKGTRSVPISSLRSPNKSAIDVSSSPAATKRFSRVLEGVRGGKTPPILVQPGSRGPKISDVGFE